jgi:uncharacterized protein with PIN domain
MRGPGAVTTALNVLEMHYALTRAGSPPVEVERIARAALRMVVEVPPDVAIQASRTRLAINEGARASGSRERLSFIDAWGYEAARAMGLRFLTGDPLFRKMPGVEFVR